MIGILTFIVVFGVIVIVHEFGHFYFAKKSGILVREFAIGMGPKIFSHSGKDGTAYTIRLLPVGGYVRLAGLVDDDIKIRTGEPVGLTVGDCGKVKKINLSRKYSNPIALSMNVISFDFEEKLEITGIVFDKNKTYLVDHDATIIEEDGTEVRIAPRDVRYQNSSIWGRLMTNFAGPMNNFILGLVAFIFLVFLQGGVPNLDTNRIKVIEGGVMKQAGVKDEDKILKIGNYKISNWDDLTHAVARTSKEAGNGNGISIEIESHGKVRNIKVTPKRIDGQYRIGVVSTLKKSFWDKIGGGFLMTWNGVLIVLTALKNLILHPSIDHLGGPIAVFQVSNQAANAGITSVISLLAMLSINIGIFNLIPIPALDGGKIILNILEGIRRKPLKRETEIYITLMGVVVMAVLMVAVTWNDIMRAFF